MPAADNNSGTEYNYGDFMATLDGEITMKKIAIFAALPVALTLAACGDNVDETAVDTDTMAEDTMADDTMADDTMADDGVATDAPATGTAPDGTPLTTDERAEVLDESAEDLEERADDIEDTNPAEAERLEREAEAQQDQRDVID